MIDTSTTVSVGIPTYNRPDLLRSRLQNVVSQSYRNLEIIVSDNASPNPEVAQICQEFAAADNRIKYVRQPANIGGPANFAFVLKEARAPLFVWAADDDEWSENFIEICVQGIGAAQLFCPQMGLKYLQSGRTETVALPDLRADDGSVASLAKFLRNTQASMVYGLHRRDDLWRFVSKGVTFDMWDVAMLYDAVVNRGITVGNEPAYWAGIAGEAYAPWTFGRPGSTDRFAFSPLIRSLFLSTLGARGLNGFAAKWHAVWASQRMVIDLISHIAIAFPDKTRRHHGWIASSQILQKIDYGRSLALLAARKVGALR